MRTAQSKILTVEQLLTARTRLRATGLRLVFTNGCFDILHAGHLSYLEFARAQGDALCVGVNSDASVRRNKGPLRPVNDATDRCRVLAGLECVDYVALFDDDEPAPLIARIIPDVLVKGADWAHYVSGRDTVESHGGKVVLAPIVAGKSTTQTLARLARLSTPEAPL
jgi:D-glycero-beta-D-manno-heptose 1-phosphate adenylyltransferase